MARFGSPTKAGIIDLSPVKGPARYKLVDFVNNDNFPEIGVVGPVASGKSTAAIDRLWRRASDYPGIHQLLARDTLVNLKSSTLVTLKRRLGRLFLPENGGSFNEQEGTFRFPPAPHPVTGEMVQSIVQGIGLDRVDLENLFKSREYGGGHIDEADQVSSDAHDLLQERSRQEFYHKSKTVKDMCMELAARWSRWAPNALTWEDAYAVLLDDPLSRVGLMQMPSDHPMPGSPTVSASWNPVGNDHTWQRYVAVPYPFPAPTEEWVNENVGIREVVVPAQVLRDDKHHFRAGALVQVAGKPGEAGSPNTANMLRRAYVQAHDPARKVATLVGGEQVADDRLDLVLQRYCIYVFSHENLSRDHQNVENTYLMVNQQMRRKHQLGHVDSRAGRVMPAYIDEPFDRGGHILPPIPLERISRSGNLIVGGLDHGGNHATAGLLGMYLPKLRALVFFAEMVKSGQSAYANAIEFQQMMVPGLTHIVGYDPAMNARVFDRDDHHRIIDNYIEVLGGVLVEGARGEAAFDELAQMLEYQDGFMPGEQPMPRIFVTEDCEQIRNTFLNLTWDMVRRRRHMWQVDVGDAAKIAASVVKRGYAETRTVEYDLRPKLGFAIKYGLRDRTRDTAL